MNNFVEVAKDIVRIVSMWPSLDSKISAASSVLRYHAGSLEWFKETSLGEYAPCMSDPCSPGSIAKQIVEDALEESDGAIQRTEALLYEWAVKLVNSNLAHPALAYRPQGEATRDARELWTRLLYKLRANIETGPKLDAEAAALIESAFQSRLASSLAQGDKFKERAIELATGIDHINQQLREVEREGEEMREALEKIIAYDPYSCEGSDCGIVKDVADIARDVLAIPAEGTKWNCDQCPAKNTARCQKDKCDFSPMEKPKSEEEATHEG